ncbi:MAG: PilZ domain-containing protein [Acidobacteriota bacterium]
MMHAKEARQRIPRGRGQPRISIHTSVTVSGIDSTGHYFSLRAEVVNGSAEGLAVLLNRELHPFTPLVISIPRDGSTFQIESEVRHVSPSDRGTVVGVQFRKTTLI